MYRLKFTGSALGLLILFLLTACNDVSEISQLAGQTADNVEMLTVYKTPTCDCCNKWIDHIETEGFKATTKHPADLGAIKDRYRIENSLRSCHTAVSSQGYVFEGHIPARYIHQFMASPPVDAIGLTVPAMPVGSPGMEYEDKFMPYQVLLMKKDGSTEVYAHVVGVAQQHQPFNQQVVQP